MLRCAVRRQSRPQNWQRRIVSRHQLAISHNIAVRFGICIGVARIPSECHLVLEVGLVIRAVAVSAFEQNYRQNCADEEHHAKRANEDEEPGLINSQIGIARKLDVLNMVGVESPEGGFAHESCEAWLGVVVAGQNRFRALREQK